MKGQQRVTPSTLIIIDGGHEMENQNMNYQELIEILSDTIILLLIEKSKKEGLEKHDENK